MTSDLDTGGESSIELRRRRTFRIRIWIGVGCLVLANLALALWGRESGTMQWVLALLPLLPIVWIVIVMVLRARQMDEYQVKLFFPGLAVGFTLSMVTAVTLGTLGSAGIAVPTSGWFVAIVGLISWEFTNLLVGAPKA
ncbi:hypothetical protein GCM10028798_23960 [Humibacter antri]